MEFIVFHEGKNEAGASGLPTDCYFFLSTKSCPADILAPVAGEFSVTDVLSSGTFGEITGTGTGRKVQSEPSPSAGDFSFLVMTWATNAATDWPAAVKSGVLCTTPDNSGVALGAWNLKPAGAAINMAGAGRFIDFTPKWVVRSQGET